MEADQRKNANKEMSKTECSSGYQFPQSGSCFAPPTEMYISFCGKPTYMHINIQVCIFNVYSHGPKTEKKQRKQQK